MRALIVVLLLLMPVVVTAQDEGGRDFTPGVYRALMRDSTAFNRFRQVELDFRQDGALIWRRRGAVQAVMSWRPQGDWFEIEEGIGCRTAPVGEYRVRSWIDGFVLEVRQDGCTARVAALNEIYLVHRDSQMVRR